ncbi:MAG: hypothetical protein JWP52_2138 [Rhizobacter sp.]|nr:hypothetical protein [Rhizobacter sp.]
MLHRRIAKIADKVKRNFWQLTIPFNNGHFSVVIDNPEIGMFAHLNVAIRILRYADENGLRPDLRFVSANYADPERESDWFNYHFEKVDAPSIKRPRHSLTIKTHRDLKLSRPDDLTLQQARDLLFKYIRIKPEITEQVDAFCSQHGIGANSLAVHYRGTDKSTEAPRVRYDAVIQAIEKTIEARGVSGPIFVASDEQRFVDTLLEHFPSGMVVAFEDSARSDGTSPLHLTHRGAGNFAMGRDALINSLLLSRCSTIVRTCSLLSSWSSPPWCGPTWRQHTAR